LPFEQPLAGEQSSAPAQVPVVHVAPELPPMYGPPEPPVNPPVPPPAKDEQQNAAAS